MSTPDYSPSIAAGLKLLDLPEVQKLDDKELRWCLSYLQCHNKAKAARDELNAQGQTARTVGWEISRREHVQEALQAMRDKLSKNGVASVVQLTDYLTRVIRTPIGAYLDERGNVDEFEIHCGENADLLEKCTKEVKEHKGETTTTWTIALPSKIAAAEKLCKLMGYNEEREGQVVVNVNELKDWKGSAPGDSDGKEDPNG